MINRVPRRLGKYEVQEPLGRGGMAEVWKAFDTQLRRNVAIKVMHTNLATDPEFITRFTREAQLIAALRHPNIVQIYDFHAGAQGGDGDDATAAASSAGMADATAASDGADTIAYMVTEYVEGQTLAQYLRGGARVSALAGPVIIRLFTPICLALDYAHQQGVIHRDIKPANILLDQRNTTRNPMGEPILSDFGLAKLLEGATATVTGTVIGTPLYMSPEQIQDKPLTDRSDLYSLGVVLYEVCAGRPPFEGDSMAGIMMRHLNEPPMPPDRLNSTLPAAVSDALVKSLAKDPQQRYPSASAMLVALAQAFSLAAPEELTSMATQRARDAEVTVAAGPAAPLDAGDATVLSHGSLATSATALAGVATAAAADATVASVPPTRPAATPASPAASSLARLAERIPAPQAVRQLRGPRLIIAIALLCALLVSGLGAVILARRNATAAPVVAGAVGQAFYLSSGQLNATTTVGINDEVQINLQGISTPQAGKSYYAWLLPDLSQSEAPDILLGKLTVQGGAAHLLYPGDSQHTDLLAITSRFLITEEASTVTPDVPTPNLSAWRYYAALPQTPAAGQKYSLLDHLRHLLAKDPDLEARGLHGGLDIWALRETQATFQWALTARDDWNAHNYEGVRRRSIAILDYLDGSANVGRDTPAGAPIYADAHVAQVGMLEFDQASQNPPGYLYHIALHLNGVLQSPGATPTQRTEATRITKALSNVKVALTQARHDAMLLSHMNDAQMAQPSTLSLLNDLVTATTTAYQGKTNPATNQMEDGMSQLYPEAQKLATFRVTSYH